MADKLVLRDLQAGDHRKGYLELLAQQWEVGEVSAAAFEERCRAVAADPGHTILVLEDTERGRIVGTATVFVEGKFIHGCGKVGHIEDVIVDRACRGLKLGHRLLDAVRARAREQGCYKAILDCAEENVAFYEKCRFSRKDVMMAHYFDRDQ